MGSLQSAILGFGAFRVLQKAGIAGFETFTVSEIVIVQTTAVATATMPLAAGASLHLESHCRHAVHSQPASRAVAGRGAHARPSSVSVLPRVTFM